MISASRKSTYLLFWTLLLSLLVLPSCKSEQHDRKQAAEELPPLDVTVITAEASKPLRQIEIMATVEAAQSASIAAKISGNITELPVKLGSQVSSGDILVVISAEEIKAKLKGKPVEYLEFLNVSALNCGVYFLAAGSTDMQSPHDDDEVYLVLSGRARDARGVRFRSVHRTSRRTSKSLAVT